MTLTWKRDKPGRQVTTDGRYAVQADGYPPNQHIANELNTTGYEGFTGGEWAAILTATDDNLDWFPTMREAKAKCQAHADAAD